MNAPLPTDKISDAVGACLDEIVDRHGSVTPELVVRYAQEPEHPLHDQFEWDDEVAGPAYRLIQARLLIRKVKYEVKGPRNETFRVRRFVNVERGTHRYEPTVRVMNDAAKRQAVLEQAKRDLDAWLRRYEGLLSADQTRIAIDLRRKLDP